MQRIVLITGTRKGIGKYLAEYYLQKGDIVIGCSRDESDIVHSDYHHFKADVGNENEVKSMFTAIRKNFKTLDVLINNAGIASMNHILLTPMKTVKNIFTTNVFGTFLLCRESAKLMQKQKKGSIVNFATVATPLQLEGEAIYASSKAAIETLTKIMAKEFAEYNITVNAVGPTPIATDLIKSVPKSKMDALINRQTIKRLGVFEDVSNCIDFFIDERSNFITGQVLFLGGVS